jgi:Zn-dependent protease with chaperone function
MGRLSAALGVLVWLVGSPAAAGTDLEKAIVTDGPDARRERAALVQALRLLPKYPWRVAVIDAEAARPEVRPSLRRLDAFTTTGGQVVYILRHSVLLRGAKAGSRFHVHALASVIWHEMAHIDGGNETRARKAEEDLWTRFIRDGQVDPMVALQYLSALKGRTHDERLALR